jgi:hypothetical protein
LRPWKNGSKRAKARTREKASREVEEAFVFCLSQLAVPVRNDQSSQSSVRQVIFRSWRFTAGAGAFSSPTLARRACQGSLAGAICRRKAASGAFIFALTLQMAVLTMEFFFVKYEEKSLKHPWVAPIKITNAKFMGA